MSKRFGVIFMIVFTVSMVFLIMPMCGCGSSEVANRIANMSNMREHVQLMHVYSNDHDDKLPENLMMMFEREYIEACFSVEDKIELPGDFEKLSEAEKQGWFDKSSYEFVWPKLKISEYEAAVEVVVIYFRDTNSEDSGEGEKYIVGYLDGHVMGDVEKKVLLEQLEKQRVFEKEMAAVGVVQ